MSTLGDLSADPPIAGPSIASSSKITSPRHAPLVTRRPSNSRNKSSFTGSEGDRLGGRRYDWGGLDETGEEEEEDAFLASLDDGDESDAETVDFDAAKWINEQLDSAIPDSSSATASLSSLDSALSNLLTKVSLARTEVGSSIEGEIQRARVHVPRIASEVGWMERSIAELQDKTQALAQSSSQGRRESDGDFALAESADGEQAVGSSNGSAAVTALAKLAELHHLHTQLSSYRSLLRVALSWSTLSTDVSLLLSEAIAEGTSRADCLANLNSASLRLKEARESLEVFGSSKEGAEKTQLLQQLTDGFEAAVVPKMGAEIRSLEDGQATSETASKETIDALKSFADVLSRIGRTNAFEECWKATRRIPLLETWSQTATMEELARVPNVPSAPPLSIFLPTFLTAMLNFLSQERRYNAELFASTQGPSLDAFILAFLQSLQPPFSIRIEAVNQHHGPKRLTEHLKIARSIRERGRDIEKLLSRVSAASIGMLSSPMAPQEGTFPPTSTDLGERRPSDTRQPPAPRSPVQQRKLSGKGGHSHRLSVSLNTSVGKEDVNGQTEDVTHKASVLIQHPEFTAALYGALVPIWDDYSRAEVSLLQSEWEIEGRAMGLLPTSTAASETDPFGDAALLETAQRLQRGWTALLDTSEDALSRCLELTRGTAASRCLAAIDAVAGNFIATAAHEAHTYSRRTWQGLVGPDARAPVGREWTAFGKVVSSLALLKQIDKGCSDLQDLLIGGFKETSNALLGLQLDKSPVIKQSEVEERLTSARGPQGAAIPGPIPTSAELALLLRSPLAMDSLELSRREQIVNLAYGATVLSQQLHPAGGDATSLLPGVSAAFAAIVDPLLHSLVLLPLAPLLSSLSHYIALSHWTSPTVPGQVSNEYQLSMPSFSIGPTEIMQSVGEGVLGLVRELETWMEEEGWKWGVQVMLARQEQTAGKVDAEAVKKERRKSSILPGGSGGGAAAAAAAAADTSPNAKLERRKSSLMPSGPRAGSMSSTLAPPDGDVGNLSPSSGNAPSPKRMTASPSGIVDDTLSPPLTRHSSHAMSNDHRSSSSQGISGADLATPPQDLLPRYINALLSMLTGHIMSQTLPHLPSKATMSAAGWKQLTADIEWLRRVVGVLEAGGGGSTDEGAASEEEKTEEGEVLGLGALRTWRDVVGTAGPTTAGTATAGFDGYVGYRPPTAGVDIGKDRAPNPLETSAFRSLLQSHWGISQGNGSGSGGHEISEQYDRGGTRGSRPSGGGSGAGGGGGVDFSAMNVGMGW